MTTPSDTGTARLRVRIDAPRDTVHAALTDADTLTEWFAESAEVDPDESRYEFWGRYTPNGDQPHQRLRTLDPLAYDWDLGDHPSTVDLVLTADGDQTVVTVAHGGVPADLTETLNCFWYVSLANLVAQCEGVATMPPFDFSAPAQGDALVRAVIDVPAEEVYASLLDPSHVDKWAGGSATIEAKVGGRYEFGLDRGPTVLTELEPDKVVAYTWQDPGNPETSVRWQLREARGSTFLTLVHSGFADDRLAERYRQTWPQYLIELKRSLELGSDWQPMREAR